MHTLIALLDPRWVDVRKKKIEERQQEEEVFAEGLNIASNIRHLAKKRTDIFGVEETVIGQEVNFIIFFHFVILPLSLLRLVQSLSQDSPHHCNGMDTLLVLRKQSKWHS